MTTNRPPWLDDVPELLALLGRFLDKLDRRPANQWKQPPSLPLEPRLFPALFRMDEASDRQWLLFKTLADAGVWEIRPDRRRDPFEAEFKGARIRLQRDAEPLVREWLGRPEAVPYAQLWQREVDHQADKFPGDVSGLRARAVALPGRSAEQLVSAFAALGALAEKNLSLRQLSARCFWGNSKLLDHRQDILLTLFPDLCITARRLLVNIYLPPHSEGVLFIENLDSYLNALEQPQLADAAGLVLVYCAGFRGSAERVRERDQVSLHYAGDSTPEQRHRLESWWFGDAEGQLSCHFWGDLDYAGIAILKTLRRRFPSIEAWQPGYARLLERLAIGHEAGEAGKQEQADPGVSGCLYADRQLLPAIRRQGRFVDQETVSWESCLKAGD